MVLTLTGGEEVEVSSKEEGFDGSWYVGSIIRPSKKREDTYVVEYHTLDHETEPKRLREFVHVSNIRPPPPPAEFQVYEPYEEVDAYYNDGWWKGVIMKVVEANSYLVYFTNTREEMQFGVSDLRIHMDWVDGSWIWSQNKGKVEPVEVSFDDEDSQGAWFPATLLKEMGNGTFLIEYQTMRYTEDVKQLKEIVNSQQIRPSPTNDSVPKSFDLLQKVDAYYDYGWWSGVITRVLDDERYSVFFKLQNKEKAFSKYELRSHMEWIDNKWLQDLTEASVRPHHQGGAESSIPSSGATSRTEAAIQPSSSTVQDNLKRKSLSSSEDLYKNIVTPPANKPLWKNKPAASRSSGETSQPYKKLKKGAASGNPMPVRSNTLTPVNKTVLKIKLTPQSNTVNTKSCMKLTKGFATKNPTPMKSCNVKGQSSRHSTDMKVQHKVSKTVPQAARTATAHDLGGRTVKKTPGGVDMKTWRVGRVDKKMVNPSKRKRTQSIGKTHKKSGQEREKVLASEINLLTGSPKRKVASSGEKMDMDVPTECVELLYDSGEGHVPFSELLKKPNFQISENGGALPENKFMPNNASTEGDVLMENGEVGNALAFVEKIIAKECNNAKDDGKNETALTSFISDATPQGDEQSLAPSVPAQIEPAKVLNNNAEKDLPSCVLLMECHSPPTEDNTGGLHENQSVLSEVVTTEDTSMEMDEHQSLTKVSIGVLYENQSMSTEVFTREDASVKMHEHQNLIDGPIGVLRENHSMLAEVVTGELEINKHQNSTEDTIGVLHENRSVLTEVVAREDASVKIHKYQNSTEDNRGVLLEKQSKLSKVIRREDVLVEMHENQKSPKNGIGVLHENQSLLNEIVVREDSPVKLHEHQSSFAVVGCSNSLDNHEVLAQNASTSGKEHNGTVLQSFAVNATASAFLSLPSQGHEGIVSYTLPFVKSPGLSLVWENIYSMKAFHLVPQQPHFCRLEQFNEEFREGMALGYMTSFANLVDKMCSATLHEPRSCLEEKLVALDDLEDLGFTVQPIRNRLQEMLRIKESFEELENSSKTVERGVIKEKYKASRLDAQVNELQKRLTETKKKLQSTITEKEMQESNLAELERTIDEIRQNIEVVRHDFNNVAAAPL